MRFQSTRPQGARLGLHRILNHLIGFQSTRPQGARRHNATWHKPIKKFQSTRPQGARRPFCGHRGRRWCFNPRARRGRDVSVTEVTLWDEGFNPRARRGRDATLGNSDVIVKVSIHAPAGGATSRRVRSTPPFRLFQSTRPQGARLHGALRPKSSIRVSIHAPAGGATPRHIGQQRREYVSIHAPAGGATRRHLPCPGQWSCFNPRARRGRDGGPACGNNSHSLVSIHAPAGGATGCSWSGHAGQSRFNPRARRRRDHPRRLIEEIRIVSIHAPAGGATRAAHRPRRTKQVSIHAPAGGATSTWPTT